MIESYCPPIPTFRDRGGRKGFSIQLSKFALRWEVFFFPSPAKGTLAFIFDYTLEHLWVWPLGRIQPSFCPWAQSRNSSSFSRDTLSPKQSFWGITLIKVPVPCRQGLKFGQHISGRSISITQVHNSKMPFWKGFSRDNSEPKSRSGLLFAIIIKAIKILDIVIYGHNKI